MSTSVLRQVEKLQCPSRTYAIVISFNENLTWSGQLFPKLGWVFVKNESLQLATIAIHDNPKLCVPPDALIRLQQLSAIATSRESTFIQHCHCDMNTLQKMAKESVVTRKTPLSVGRCVVFNGDLTIDKSVPENLKHAMSNIRTIHGTITVQDSTWKEFRLPVLEVIENVSKKPAIFIKDNAYLENVSMPFLRSLLSAGDHVHIYDNPRLRLSDFMRETFQTAVLADPTDHSSSTIHIKTSPCRINATGISKELQHCDSIDGDINISGDSNVVRTNLEYLSSVPEAHKVTLLSGITGFRFQFGSYFLFRFFVADINNASLYHDVRYYGVDVRFPRIDLIIQEEVEVWGVEMYVKCFMVIPVIQSPIPFYLI
ncbi:unnamed protein product [Haemonchus placei]|uniref:Recep_L_domain domain-containing protein n=1 Tax=Haemonchus placei TaxID=6290 RepID=A0A158QKL3_HAEPC|nr:unnamed protein product [Haemonchus placei]